MAIIYTWEKYKANKNAFVSDGTATTFYLYNQSHPNYTVGNSPAEAEMAKHGTDAFYKDGADGYSYLFPAENSSRYHTERYIYTYNYMLEVPEPAPDGIHWVVGPKSRAGITVLTYIETGENIRFNVYTPRVSKGEYIGTVTSTDISNPGEGYDGSAYWYVYKGAESTNPTAPSYVTAPAEVSPRDVFTVTWGASTDPNGDLAGYEVESSYDGSSTWHSGGTHTETSVTALIPESESGAKTVQYRVRAFDAEGSYSAWTYSNTVIIRNLRAYVGVDNKARAVKKIYVGVNGKARAVIKGYVGVNGKARRFM